MPNQQILVVEDDEDIVELLRFNLEKEGYRVVAAYDGEAGLKQVESSLPDAVILDLMLPGIDGLQVCRALRRASRTAHVPLLMLTAKGEESDIITGLELGADDYLTKPFSPKVLVARLRAVLRRRAREAVPEEEPVSVHEIVIDPRRHEVLVRGKPVSLTATEFALLGFLARRPGWVFTRQQIVDAVKGTDYPVTERSVDVQMVGLRRKLGRCGAYLETVRGVGYRFTEKA